MRRRRPNHRLVKIHRTYTVEEIVDLFGVHKNTVRHWVKDGLTTTDDKRPMLILGHVLVAFLKAPASKTNRLASRGNFIASAVAPRNLLPVVWRIIFLLPKSSATSLPSARTAIP